MEDAVVIVAVGGGDWWLVSDGDVGDFSVSVGIKQSQWQDVTQLNIIFLSLDEVQTLIHQPALPSSKH